MPSGNKRRKGKQGTRGAIEPTEQTAAPPPDTAVTVQEHKQEAPKEPPLVLTSEKKRGTYECDYCHADISQVPRIRCAVCPDFDLCLDCFGTADHKASIARLQASRTVHHDDSHGYRVADSTRYTLFPTSRTLSAPSRPPSCVGDNDSNHNTVDGDEAAVVNSDKEAKETAPERNNEELTKETAQEKDVDESKTEDKTQDKAQVKDVVMEDASVETLKPQVKHVDASTEKVQEPDTCMKRTVHTDTASALALQQQQQELEQDEESVLVVQEDPKCTWTVEEDLRLLDAIACCGLGNWADISEAISGQGSVNKTPKRCMERYFDDFLGRYGRILPAYTVVDCDDEEDEEDSTDEASRASKRRRLGLMRSYSAISIVSQTSGRKKRRAVPTTSLLGHDELWPEPYVPPGAEMDQEVGRDTRMRAEQNYAKLLSQVSSQEEADKLRQEWKETRLNKPDGPTALPLRPEDLVALPGSDLAGYMPRRGDFDLEWENDAEAMIGDMEFSPNDSPQDRQLKLQVIEIYNSKLDERERRKQFLLSRDLVDYRKNQKADDQLPRDERFLVRRMRLFERLHTPEEHKQFIADILKAKRLRKEIAKLQMYRRMGIKTLAEAEKYELDKERREFHKNAQLQKEADRAAAAAGGVAGGGDGSFASGAESSSLWKQYKTTRVRRSTSRASDSAVSPANEAGEMKESAVDLTAPAASEKKESPVAAAPSGEHAAKEKSVATTEAQNPAASAPVSSGMEKSTPTGEKPASPEKKSFDVLQYPGSDLLSSKEVELCENLRLLPSQYLEVKSALIQESMKQGLLDKEAAKRTIVKVDVEKRGDVIDFMVRAGWISSTRRMGAGANQKPSSVPSA